MEKKKWRREGKEEEERDIKAGQNVWEMEGQHWQKRRRKREEAERIGVGGGGGGGDGVLQVQQQKCMQDADEQSHQRVEKSSELSLCCCFQSPLTAHLFNV